MRAFESVRFKAVKPGIRLIVTGAVHGNETCGTVALRRLIDEVSKGKLDLVAGEVTFVPVTNPLAYERRQREGDRNLNRRLLPTDDPRQFEDHVANWLCPLLAQHDALLDLHSFRSPGVPFALVGPDNNNDSLEPFAHACQESALAVRLGVTRLVDGWLTTYASGMARRRTRSALTGSSGPPVHADYGVGTTEYMRRSGGWALTLECGQHDDPLAPEVAYQAVKSALAHLGLTAEPDPAAATEVQALRLFDVVDKEHVGDDFTRPWTSFDPVQKGDVIAMRHDGTRLRADFDGFIVFPNQGADVGHEWFYLARPTDRFSRTL
jgi:predicted deacylase